jgi:hypothetical protein
LIKIKTVKNSNDVLKGWTRSTKWANELIVGLFLWVWESWSNVGMMDRFSSLELFEIRSSEVENVLDRKET